VSSRVAFQHTHDSTSSPKLGVFGNLDVSGRLSRLKLAITPFSGANMCPSGAFTLLLLRFAMPQRVLWVISLFLFWGLAKAQTPAPTTTFKIHAQKE
jgi:hypothetical protein